MKKTIAVCAMVLLCCVFVFGESSVWKAKKNGREIYLGGSVHILRSGDFPLPLEFDAAFEQADIVVLETDIEALSSPEIAFSIINQMMLPEDETLETILNRDVYEKLKNKCGEYGFSIGDVVYMKPAMLINILTMMEIQQLGYLEQGADIYYASRAKEAGKGSGYLESLELQIDLLMNMGSGHENEYVLYSLDDFEQTEETIDSLVREWKQGAAGTVEAQLAEMRESFPSIYKTLIADRNNAWIPVIEQYLGDAPVEFIIAGLAHFYGPDGLLIQLKNRGYTVERFVIGE
jgi:uncharacterized protein YbaP (TraB family)